MKKTIESLLDQLGETRHKKTQAVAQVAELQRQIAELQSAGEFQEADKLAADLAKAERLLSGLEVRQAAITRQALELHRQAVCEQAAQALERAQVAAKQTQDLGAELQKLELKVQAAQAESGSAMAAYQRYTIEAARLSNPASPESLQWIAAFV
jgi:chromosome segregation ATPase